MKKQTIGLVVVVILVLLYIMSRPPKEGFGEGFLGWDWRPWRWHMPWYGSMHVPWYSQQQSYWQYPHSFVPWGPSSGQTVMPPQGCPQRVWDQYQDRLRRYNDCQKCKPGCVVNTQTGECGNCSYNQGSCEEQWGCTRSGGGHMPPVPPNLSGCTVCQ